MLEWMCDEMDESLWDPGRLWLPAESSIAAATVAPEHTTDRMLAPPAADVRLLELGWASTWSPEPRCREALEELARHDSTPIAAKFAELLTHWDQRWSGPRASR